MNVLFVIKLHNLQNELDFKEPPMTKIQRGCSHMVVKYVKITLCYIFVLGYHFLLTYYK